jgi:hypothetical protein
MTMKVLLAPALAGSLFLAGCDTSGTAANIAAEISAVQQTATQICGFLPTVGTVTSIISTFIPGAVPINDEALQVAQMICSAVTAKSVRRSGGSAPMVRGVPVQGRFVR